jgi:hypothetical protein
MLDRIDREEIENSFARPHCHAAANRNTRRGLPAHGPPFAEKHVHRDDATPARLSAGSVCSPMASRYAAAHGWI